MAFEWSSLQAGDPIEASDFNEVKTNLDSIFTFLGITPDPVWTAEWDLEAGDQIKSAHAQELRSKTDYADDNWCSTHHSDHKSSYCSTHYSDHDDSHNSSYCSSQNSSQETSDNTTDNSNYKTSQDAVHYSPVY